MNKISIRNVVKAFDSKIAVRDVSFEIPEGRIFGLLGPNGAGKTTLIRMIMDIFKPDTGEILIDGHAMTLEDKDRITYLPEERGLYRKEKVRDILEYFAQLKGMAPRDATRRTTQCLQRLEMSDTASKKVEELSKGNQQKIQIAAALVSDPEVIILDEPFAGLDPLNVELAKAVISEEKKIGKTVLLSTHQMNQVEELCDNLMMINFGRLVLYGAVQFILEQHSEPAFLVECRGLDGSLPELEKIVDEGAAKKLFPRPGISPTELIRKLLERGVEIDSFQKASTPLEQIFVKVARDSAAEARK